MKILPLDHTVTTALHTLLDYLECERSNYEATPPAERGHHIYHSVISIADWLEAFGSDRKGPVALASGPFHNGNYATIKLLNQVMKDWTGEAPWYRKDRITDCA